MADYSQGPLRERQERRQPCWHGSLWSFRAEPHLLQSPQRLWSAPKNCFSLRISFYVFRFLEVANTKKLVYILCIAPAARLFTHDWSNVPTGIPLPMMSSENRRVIRAGLVQNNWLLLHWLKGFPPQLKWASYHRFCTATGWLQWGQLPQIPHSGTLFPKRNCTFCLLPITTGPFRCISAQPSDTEV